MLLTTSSAVIAPGDQQFTFVVPGHQTWAPRAVYAIASRAAGGLPDRRYILTVTDGTNTVANVGAADNGTEPGTCDVTWAQCPAASVAAGAVGVSVAPLAPMTLPPGYLIGGSIVSPDPDDEWLNAIIWYDFVYNTPPGVF